MRKRMSKEMWDEGMKKAASERLKGYWEKPEYRKKNGTNVKGDVG